MIRLPDLLQPQLLWVDGGVGHAHSLLAIHFNLVDLGVVSIAKGSPVRAFEARGVDRQLSFGFPPAAWTT
jgi:hypothetical protein